MPDITIVFGNRAIGREPAGICNVGKAFLTPFIPVQIALPDTVSSLIIAVKVFQDPELIIMVPDFIIDPLELTFIRREGSVNGSFTE